MVVLLYPEILAPPVCSLGGPEPPPRSQTSMILGTGGFGVFVLCMLVFMAFSEDKRQKQRCAHNNGIIKKKWLISGRAGYIKHGKKQHAIETNTQGITEQELLF